MSEMSKISVVFRNFLGAPGVSTFYHAGTEPDLQPYATLYAALNGSLPSGLTWEIERTGVTLSDIDGAVTGAWSYDGLAVTGGVGTSGTDYVGGTGAVIRWETGTVERKRRVRGHTYIVPIGGGNFTTAGQVGAATVAAFKAAADTFIADASGGALVWHRPKAPDAGEGKIVTASFVPSTPAFLRSRRD